MAPSFRALLALWALIFGWLCAQGSDTSSTRLAVEGDSVVTLLDEVNVVAQKVGNDYRSMALSGTLLNRMQTEQLGIVDTKGLSEVVPNFYIPDYGSRITSSIYVRGIGARMDQPAVGLTIDNVSILNKDAYDFDISDISSMEMLHGPQSILFGRNTMTGLISIRTLSPMEFQGWRTKVDIGLHSHFRANLGWYHRFNSRIGASVVGTFFRDAGVFKNLYNNQPVDREVSGSLRSKFQWNPSRKVNLSNTIYLSILRQGGYAYESVASGEINYNDTCFYRRFLVHDGLTLNARIGNMELVSVSTVQHINDNMTLDQDFLPESYFTLTQKKRETSLTEEIMLKGSAENSGYNWLVGAYGFYRDLHMTAPVTFKDYGISQLIEHYRNQANPSYPIRWNERQFPLNSDFYLPSGGVAIYHESRLELGNWRLAAGLRLDYERISMTYHSQCQTSYDILRNPSGVLPAPENAEVYRSVNVDIDEQGKLHKQYLMLLPKISAVWDIPSMDEANLYASVGKGYKAGGFNTQMFSDVLQQKLMQYMGLAGKYDVDEIVGYKPEKAWTYEIGGHFNFLNSRLRADISLFYIDCRDQQLTRFPEGTTTGRMMTNAGRTRSLGGELSMVWNPFDRFNLMTTYGFTDARFVEYNDGQANYKGKRLPYAPSNTLFAEASYSILCSTTGKYRIDVAANFSGAGNIYWNEANTLSQKFYGLLGLRIGYHSPRWGVEVWGKNLTATKYYTFYFVSMGNEFRQKGRPVDVGVSLTARF